MSNLFDKLRIGVGVLLLGGLLVLGGLGIINNRAKILGTQSEGQVAGESTIAKNIDLQREGIQEQIDQIKQDITQIKPEDLKQHDAIEKILKDLDELKGKASDSGKVLDVKGNLCEEVKKRFCE